MYAGALSFEDGMKVVKARAEAMHAAAQQGGGSGMASVAGLDDPGMKKLIAEASKAVGGGKEAYIANYLFPGGRTLSGDIDVLDWICANAAARGVDSKNSPRRVTLGIFEARPTRGNPRDPVTISPKSATALYPSYCKKTTPYDNTHE